MNPFLPLFVGLASAVVPGSYHLDFEVRTNQDTPVHAQLEIEPGHTGTLTRGDLQVSVTAEPGAPTADGAETAKLDFKLSRADRLKGSSRIIVKLGQEAKMTSTEQNGKNSFSLTVTPTRSKTD